MYWNIMYWSDKWIPMLLIFHCIPRCCHLLDAGSCRSISKTLRTSLQVLIPHPRHHSSWIGALLPFGYLFIAGRLCINDVAQHNYIVFEASCFLWIILRLPFSLYSSKALSFAMKSSWFIFMYAYWSESLTIITCSSEQVSSFVSCRWLYAIFPTSQIH